VHVVVHAPQDGVHHALLGIATLAGVAVDLLDPLQVDDGHDADQQVYVLGDVHTIGDEAAVQALVEQQVGARRQALPGREGADWLAVFGGIGLRMQILADLAFAVLAVAAEQLLEPVEQIGGRAEVAEVLAADGGPMQMLAHLLPVVGVEAVALDDGGAQVHAREDVLEGGFGRTGSGPGGTGDGDDGMFGRHVASCGFFPEYRPTYSTEEDRWQRVLWQATEQQIPHAMT